MITIFIRLCAILFGYAFAILSASVFLHLLAWPSLGLEGNDPSIVAQSALAVSVVLAALFMSYYAFFPAIILLAIAELKPVRNWLYFAFAGAGTAIAAISLFELTSSVRTSMLRADAIALSAPALGGSLSAGIVGGITYWLIAGRNAGKWRNRSGPISPAPSKS